MRGEALSGPAGHSDHGHSHGHGANERATLIAACLTGGFMVAEAAGGLIANSLTLLADAAHMFTDTAALALAWWAFRQARRPVTPAMSYGHDRMPVLVAFANAVVLLLLSLWIVVEAVQRFLDPQPVAGATVLVIATLGLAVNLVAFGVLSGAGTSNLNIRGALLHVASDILGSVAALTAGAVILLTGWTPIDPLLSIVVSALIVRVTIKLLRSSAHILLEGAPAGVTGAAIGADLLANVAGVKAVHHVHTWSLSEEKLVATLHVVVEEGADRAALLAAIRARLAEAFRVEHATIELEAAS